MLDLVRVNIAWHETPLTTWRTKRSKIRIFLFILFPICFCPTISLIKKGQELKQNNWKYLRDLTRTKVTKISRISWRRHLPVNCFFFFLQWRAIFFFLHGQDKDTDRFTWPPIYSTETVPMYRQGKPPSFSTYDMRTIKLSRPCQN